MKFLIFFIMTMENLEISESNYTFHSDCRVYLDALQKQGKQDDGFEDEFYYTLPAISRIE